MTHILHEGRSPVCWTTIDRPNRLNSPDFAASHQLVEVWRVFAPDQPMRAAVVTGSAAEAFDACNHQLILRQTADLTEGASAFPEKRPPPLPTR